MPPKKPKTLLAVSEKQFREADRIDRLYMAMLEPSFILNEEDEEYSRLLHQAYQGCFEEIRKSKAIAYIQSLPGCESVYRAHRIYEDMGLLFGRFVEKNIELRRRIVVEKLYSYAEMAEEDGDYALAAKILKDAAQIEGLQNIEAAIAPPMLELPQIIITNDPEAHFETLRLETSEEADDDEEG